MRVLLSSAPKMGHVWVKHILLSVYPNLKQLPAKQEPEDTLESFREFVSSGSFVDNTTFHMHYRFSNELCDLCDKISCHIVTPIRNPYDAFVSFYYFIQRFSERFIAADTVDARVVGKPIDHPIVLDELLRETFAYHLVLANEWVQSRRSIIVRYENLHSEPYDEIRKLTDRIEPVDDLAIRTAISDTTPDKMRQRSHFLARHVRTATVGDWRNYLTDQHLDIFRTDHAELVKGLGYEVL